MTTAFRNLTRSEATICLTEALDQIIKEPETWVQENWHSDYTIWSGGKMECVTPDRITGYCGTAHCLAGWGQVIARERYGIPVVKLEFEGYAKFFSLSETECRVFSSSNDLDTLKTYIDNLLNANSVPEDISLEHFLKYCVSPKSIRYYLAENLLDLDISYQDVAGEASASYEALNKLAPENLESMAYEATRYVLRGWVRGIAQKVIEGIVQGRYLWRQEYYSHTDEYGQFSGCFWGHFDWLLRGEVTREIPNHPRIDPEAEMIFEDSKLVEVCEIGVRQFELIVNSTNDLDQLCVAYNEAFPDNRSVFVLPINPPQ
jgi:hypothetical protein